MKYFFIIFIWLCVTVTAAPQSAPEDDDVDLTQSKSRACYTPDNREGICVDSGTCMDNYTIAIYGDIDLSELRARSRCPGEFQWCCVYPNTSVITEPPQTATTPPLGVVELGVNVSNGSTVDRFGTPTPMEPLKRCRTARKDYCPWCVALYRINPRTGAPQLFCGGAVVGSRLVLTSASCAMAHRWADPWAQLPSDSRRYPVNITVSHRQFQSGVKIHDVALLVLNEHVVWPERQQENLGACLGLRNPLEGDCMALTFDDSDQPKFTPLTINGTGCGPRGATYDAACGHATTSGGCSVAPGSPVLCPSGSDDLVIAGLVKQKCIRDSTLLGSLMPSAEWLTEELTIFALHTDQYTVEL